MKKISLTSLFFLLFAVIQTAVFGQDNVRQTESDIKSWFSQNWHWVIGGGLVLLLLIVSFGGKKSSQKTTTVVKDDLGNIKSVTSTEIRE